MAQVSLDLAKESSVQEIKNLIGENVQYTNITLFPSDDGIKNSRTLSKTKTVSSATAYYKMYSFIPKNSGEVRINYTIKNTITANSYSSSSSSSNNVRIYASNNFLLFDASEGNSVTATNTELISENCSVGVGASTTYPVGTTKTVSGTKDIKVTQGIPVTILASIDQNSSFSNITVRGDFQIDVIYKEVSW